MTPTRPPPPPPRRIPRDNDSRAARRCGPAPGADAPKSGGRKGKGGGGKKEPQSQEDLDSGMDAYFAKKNAAAAAPATDGAADAAPAESAQQKAPSA